jgi:RimJ/RimL family protein N-acetyltransferase
MEQPAEVLSNGPVRLRRWRGTDTEDVYRVVMDSLDHLLPWMPWAAGYDRARAAEFMALCEHDWDAGLAYNYAVVTGDGEVVGSIGLLRRAGAGGMEIGYWLHPAHTGRGLATAASAALVSAAFALPGVEFVEIVHDLANNASGGVPRRLGFTQVGRRTRSQEPGTPGESGVELVWRLTREQAAEATRRST